MFYLRNFGRDIKDGRFAAEYFNPLNSISQIGFESQQKWFAKPRFI